jgi:hypothetical protein
MPISTSPETLRYLPLDPTPPDCFSIPPSVTAPPQALDSPVSSGTQPQCSKDQRRHSIESLNLAPIPDDAVRIIVEDGKKQQFVVHRSLISHFSSYFNKYFHGKEPVAKTITIPSFTYVNELDFQHIDDICSKNEIGDKRIEIKINLPAPGLYNEITLPKVLGRVRRPVFAAFIQWLYRAFPGQLFPPTDLDIDAPTLIELWVLAGRLGVPGCQNDCILAIELERRKTNIIETAKIRWVYENTREYERGCCGLRNLLVDQCAWVLDENWLLGALDGTANAGQFPRECLVDIVARLRVLLREGIKGPEPLKDIEGRKGGNYWVKDYEIGA